MGGKVKSKWAINALQKELLLLTSRTKVGIFIASQKQKSESTKKVI